MAFLRPHLNESLTISYLPAAIENVIVLAVILLAIFFRKKQNKISPEVLYSIFFSVSLLIIAGYTITLSGAIVRYKSIALPILIVPLACLIDWEMILKKLKHKFVSTNRYSQVKVLPK